MTDSPLPLVLAVDDEQAVLRLIRLALAGEPFRVTTAETGSEALQQASQQQPDVLLLDLLLPDMSGAEVLEKLPRRQEIAVILLTAADADRDAALDLGADDYIPKPFEPDDLASRIKAVLRRFEGVIHPWEIYRRHGVEIDLSLREARRGTVTLQLSRTEWRLLELLAARAGEPVSGTVLLTGVWGPDYRDDLDFLSMWIARLRSKLEFDPAHPSIITTVAGTSYQMEASDRP